MGECKFIIHSVRHLFLCWKGCRVGAIVASGGCKVTIGGSGWIVRVSATSLTLKKEVLRFVSKLVEGKGSWWSLDLMSVTSLTLKKKVLWFVSKLEGVTIRIGKGG